MHFGIFGDRYIGRYYQYFDYNYCILNGYSIDHNHDKESLNDYLYNKNKYDLTNINDEKYHKLFESLNVNNYQSRILLQILIEKHGGIPDNFNCDTYVRLNKDLINLTKIHLMLHYVCYGRNEKRKYIE